jgi:hypothetical protein
LLIDRPLTEEPAGRVAQTALMTNAVTRLENAERRSGRSIFDLPQGE